MAQESLHFLRVLRGSKTASFAQRMLRDLEAGAASSAATALIPRYASEARNLQHGKAAKVSSSQRNSLLGAVHLKYPFVSRVRHSAVAPRCLMLSDRDLADLLPGLL